MAGIKEVAELAGVSIATVSRVINKNPNVKKHLRKRVLDAIDKLNYQPSGIARNMRKQRSPSVGIIISDIQNPFFTSLVRAVEDKALEYRYNALLCNSDEDPEKEQLYIDVLVRERVAGIIIVPSHEDTCQSLSNLKIPIVVVDRRLKCLKTDSVVLDNIYGSQIATRHLLHLGHRRIGLIGAPHNVSVGLDRQRGYEKALEDYGIPVDGALIEIGNFKEEGGYKAARKLLEMNNRPTALFAVNSLMTMGMLHAINELNLRIPDDISVIGFDDMPWLSLLNPPLTAVSQPVYEIGTKASELLFDRISGNINKPIESIVMNPELRLRASTRKLLKS